MCFKGYVESVRGHNSYHIYPTIANVIRTIFVPYSYHIRLCCSYHIRTMFVPCSYHIQRTFCLVLIGCSIRTIFVPYTYHVIRTVFVPYSYHVISTLLVPYQYLQESSFAKQFDWFNYSYPIRTFFSVQFVPYSYPNLTSIKQKSTFYSYHFNTDFVRFLNLNSFEFDPISYHQFWVF